MLEQVIAVFDDMREMMKKLKKASYERNMKEFRRKNDHFFMEMLAYVERQEDRKMAADEVSRIFTGAVENEFTVRGKIRGALQADLNFFMIYYVFPAILMTQHEEAKLLADRLCRMWGETFKNSKIGYTDYDNLYNSFNEKILGLF